MHKTIVGPINNWLSSLARVRN